MYRSNTSYLFSFFCIAICQQTSQCTVDCFEHRPNRNVLHNQTHCNHTITKQGRMAATTDKEFKRGWKQYAYSHKPCAILTADKDCEQYSRDSQTTKKTTKKKSMTRQC